jgi:hypothetical protein
MSLVFGIATQIQNKDYLPNFWGIIILHMYLQLFGENIVKWFEIGF